MNYLLPVVFSALILFSCGKIDSKPSAEELKVSEMRIEKDRNEKDGYFKSAESPLNDSLKALFHGLEYFPFDPAFVFKVKLRRYDEPRELDMITSKGKLKHYVEYGYFEFSLNGTQRLNVYRPKPALEGHPDYLFIPFKDATTGKESYPAGRYMELTLNTSDEYLLDFNTAYNPWCAYNHERYNCPYPPKENFLPVAVSAGEKKFLLREH